jgi:hypothetical protein
MLAPTAAPPFAPWIVKFNLFIINALELLEKVMFDVSVSVLPAAAELKAVDNPVQLDIAAIASCSNVNIPMAAIINAANKKTARPLPALALFLLFVSIRFAS